MIEATVSGMVPDGFVVAMRAGLSLSPYGVPHRAGRAVREWLIVCRWGREGEYRSIARAGPAEGADSAPPPEGPASGSWWPGSESWASIRRSWTSEWRLTPISSSGGCGPGTCR